MTSCIYPQWDAPPHVGALATTRLGGVSTGPFDDGAGGGGLNLGKHVNDSPQHVAQNRELLAQLAGPSLVRPVWLSQVHGAAVADAATAAPNCEADAAVATEPGVGCAILTADCLPVLFCDTVGKVVGAAHAGWRGLASGVLENTVVRMHELAVGMGAGELLAWFGPAIGPQSFEVGEDVLQAFVARHAAAEAAFQPIAGKPGKYLADIYALARLRLRDVGVERISGGDCCTVRERRFYSYRRDGSSGRMASLIWIKS
ncbi:MAG: peptidoglycan editing factor PgeF [Burkholderiaceae bacterium]|nr:peptidoglycan editing factor PgeF [Burkholderiaceae bacterium]